jgi:adenylate cyclase
MAVKREIERKFLLPSRPDLADPLLAGAPRLEIEQTYLLGSPGRSERVRAVREQGRDERFYHTRKRRLSSLSREEEEHEVDRARYEELVSRRDPARGTIRKTRLVFSFAAHRFELDLFESPAGVVLLEVELASEDEPVELPPFRGLSEVTGDERYSNSELARRAERPD